MQTKTVFEKYDTGAKKNENVGALAKVEKDRERLNILEKNFEYR